MAIPALRYTDQLGSPVELTRAPVGGDRRRSAPGEERDVAAAVDKRLIAAVAQGDRRAFETIYDRYAPAVFGLTLKMLVDYQAAEDAVQEVFLRVWQRAGTFDGRRSFAPWLFGIAHDYCIDEIRRRRVRPQPVYEDAEGWLLRAIPDENDFVTTSLLVEQGRIVARALGQLPAEQRQAISLAYFEGLTRGEIADRLGSPVGTIKTRLRVGLQKLRQILRNEALIEDA